MPVFKTTNGDQLKKLNVLPLSKERDLQRLIEKNLLETLGLQFLATEYPTTSGGRMDTLAVDSDGAPVIIEYKKNRNDAVINQALSYMRWLKTQKSEFFQKLMIDKLGQKAHDEIGLDWKNPRVICIAEAFSRFDIDTIHFVSARIELIRYRIYEDGIFTLEPINVLEAVSQTDEAAKESKVVKSEQPKDSSNEMPIVEDFVEKASPMVREIFYDLRERILALDEAIIEKPTTLYVGYKLSNNFADLHFQRSGLKIFLRPLTYDDPKGLVKQIPDGYKWKLNKFVQISNLEDSDYVFGLIEQSYKDVL
jgi:predicted transport protein